MGLPPCSLGRKRRCFPAARASSAPPTWGLLASHWRSVEFWVTAQPQATAGSALAILCRFSPRDIVGNFSPFLSVTTCSPSAPPHWHCLQSPVQLVLIACRCHTPQHHLFVMHGTAASTETTCSKFHYPRAIYLMDNARDAKWKSRIRPCL